MATQPKVLIIGAGIGGLALAQILLAKGVPFEIFERDEGVHGRGQGWAVALQESVGPLQEQLGPEHSRDFTGNSVNIHTDTYDEIGFVDANTGERVGKIGGVAIGQPGYILRVSREHFRDYLWSLNGLSVSAGKYFKRYEVDDDGITAFFADGSSARGTLLVGADGIHSHTLDQLTGSVHHPVASKWVSVVGEVRLLPERFRPLREMASAVVLCGSERTRMQIGLLETAPDMSWAQYFYAVTIRCEHDAEQKADWVQHHATKQELYDWVLEATRDFDESVADIIHFGGVDAISSNQIKFAEFAPPDTLPSGRIAVLGDAAHAMIPFRAAGANTAVLDACDLGAALAGAHARGEDLASIVPAYNTTMIPRGRSNVFASHDAGEIPGSPVAEWHRVFARR